jgi:hypothetical protein
MLTRKSGVIALLMSAVLLACSKSASPTSPTTDTTTPPATSLPSCTAWAAQQRASGLPPPIGSVVSQRQALYDAGGGVRALGTRYYGAYFPSAFATQSRKRVMIALHGTGGSPETEWAIDWAGELPARNWAFLALKYVDDSTGVHDDNTIIYGNIKSMVDDVRANCDIGTVSYFLAGFSRGSAESFPVTYLDLKDRHLIKATSNNSGAWLLDMAMPPTLEGIVARNEGSAFSGAKFWMYCGEQDMGHGYPMCDEMVNARTFVETRGGSILGFYRDPTGGHGGLNKNAAAMSEMFMAFEGL